MTLRLKEIANEVVVITGALRGIGRAMALMSAARGATDALAARNERALHDVAAEIGNGRIDKAFVIPVDVLDQLRSRGWQRQWLINAALSAGGGTMPAPRMPPRLKQVTLEDARRLFDVKFWVVVIGMVRHAGHKRGDRSLMTVSFTYPEALLLARALG